MDNIKREYETPVCEVIEFDTEDVITTSGLGDDIPGADDDIG